MSGTIPIGKVQGGAEVGPYKWEKPGSVCEVDAATAATLLRQPGGGFFEATSTGGGMPGTVPGGGGEPSVDPRILIAAAVDPLAAELADLRREVAELRAAISDNGGSPGSGEAGNGTPAAAKTAAPAKTPSKTAAGK